jgi:hypothetical protein
MAGHFLLRGLERVARFAQRLALSQAGLYVSIATLFACQPGVDTLQCIQ